MNNKNFISSFLDPLFEICDNDEYLINSYLQLYRKYIFEEFFLPIKELISSLFSFFGSNSSILLLILVAVSKSLIVNLFNSLYNDDIIECMMNVPNFILIL